jgi:8-oxo-dGTP diphosphatase
VEDTVVVAAAIVRDGRLLAARRTGPPRLAGRWELPGGKVEPTDESERAALVREIDEELGVLVAVGDQLGAAIPLGPSCCLRIFNASLLAGEPRPKQAHSAVCWLRAGELGTVDWVEADRSAVALLAVRLRHRAPVGTAPAATVSLPPAADVSQGFQGSDGVLDGSGHDRSLGLFRGRAGPPAWPDARLGGSCSGYERDGSGEYAR